MDADRAGDAEASGLLGSMRERACILQQPGGLSVAVVGGGLAGLMAARQLASWGARVHVFEARSGVGGRVLSDMKFATGRVTEFGAELIGSIHTRWCALAKEYGLGLITRTDAAHFHGMQLEPRVIHDRLLDPAEVRSLDQAVRKILTRIAECAQANIRAGMESRPWDQPDLARFDCTVEQALTTKFGVQKDTELWKALRLFLVNNNVSQLNEMSFLALLCLVRGGQVERSTIGDPLMGYWDELEIYRCASGCQSLALALAADVNSRTGCKVYSQLAVGRIDLRPKIGGVMLTTRSTADGKFDRWIRENYPSSPLTDLRHYDRVVLAVPPSVWGGIDVGPSHPKNLGLMGDGPAVKFFSVVKDRFWIRDGYAPLGGSLAIGQVWEGTDNQTRVNRRGIKQDIVLSAYTGARSLTTKQYTAGLSDLYPSNPRIKDRGYANNLVRTQLVDWSREAFIHTGFSAPRVGQVIPIGRALNRAFLDRLVFAGEHTQLDHFGYMEGAIRSGERAAHLLIDTVCPPARVAAASSRPPAAAG